MPPGGSLVLDSYALIGYLEGEPFSARIADLLKQAKNAQLALYTHALHLGEVYYITFREKGKDMADLVYGLIKRLPITIVHDISEELLLAAASLKAQYPVSYADSFAAALAQIKRCPMLSGDPEFKKLEKEGAVKVLWL